MNIIKSKRVEKYNDLFLLHIGYKHYDLGIQVHGWGIRFMFIWWHVIFHFKKKWLYLLYECIILILQHKKENYGR